MNENKNSANHLERLLLDAMLEGVIQVSNQGTIVMLNHQAEAMFGVKEDEVINKEIYEVLKIEDEDGHILPLKQNPFNKARESKTKVTADPEIIYFFTKDDGTRFPIDITVVPLQNNSEESGFLGFIHDITKEIESDRTASEFTSIASHQLRTPAVSLNWLIEALVDSFEKKELTEQQKVNIKDLVTSIKRMIWLVEDLLNMSRIQLDTLVIDEKEIDIEEFIENLMRSIKPYAQSKEHTMQFIKSDEDYPKVVIDPKILYNIMQNLISNAIDYSPHNSKIVITLKKEKDFIKIAVSNSGPAIPEEEQEHLFKKFYRGESVKKMKPEGTGLGLYIMKTFVERINGSVGFESGKEYGATFWFTIPLR